MQSATKYDMGFRSLWKFVVARVKKPVRDYNVIERAEKSLDIEKRRSAPRHPGTEEKFEKLLKGNPGIKVEHEKKPEDLLNRLKIVKVTSTDELPKVESHRSARALPQARIAQSVPDFGYEEPKIIPVGKCSLRQALEFITKIQNDPENWTIQKVAEEYNLNSTDVENVVNHFRTFYVIYNKASRKGLAGTHLDVLGAHKTVSLEPKYRGDTDDSSELVNKDAEKR